jgi:hypothetical protein
MRILCVATGEPWPAAKAALERYAPQAEIVSVAAGDSYAYWQAVATRWDATDDLLIVEHDITIHAKVLPQLAGCVDSWCVFPYRHPLRLDGWLESALGCTRFSADFQDAVTPPDIMYLPYWSALYGQPCCKKRPCWRHLDTRIREAAERLGFHPHIHSPTVGHRKVPPGEDWRPQEARGRLTTRLGPDGRFVHEYAKKADK